MSGINVGIIWLMGASLNEDAVTEVTNYIISNDQSYIDNPAPAWGSGCTWLHFDYKSLNELASYIQACGYDIASAGYLTDSGVSTMDEAVYTARQEGNINPDWDHNYTSGSLVIELKELLRTIPVTITVTAIQQ